MTSFVIYLLVVVVIKKLVTSSCDELARNFTPRQGGGDLDKGNWLLAQSGLEDWKAMDDNDIALLFQWLTCMTLLWMPNAEPISSGTCKPLLSPGPGCIYKATASVGHSLFLSSTNYPYNHPIPPPQKNVTKIRELWNDKVLFGLPFTYSTTITFLFYIY